MKKMYLLLVTVTCLWQVVHALDPYELPLGMYCTKDDFIIDDISALGDTLGVTFVYGLSGTPAVVVGLLNQAGYDIIKWGSADPYNPSKASDFSYLKVEAEDSTSPIKFETRLGNDSGDFMVYSGQDTMLDDLWFGQYPTEAYRGSNAPKTFYAQVRLAINTTGVVLGDTIGRILVQRQDTDSTWSLHGNLIVTATQELLNGDTIEVPTDNQYFRLCEQGSCARSYKVKYSFWNSGATTIYLDYLKSYEQTGLEIVEDTTLNSTIRAAVTGEWEGQVNDWWLRDEPRYDHFRTMAKVRSLVNDELSRQATLTALLLTSVRPGFDTTQMRLGLKSFLQLTGQERIVINDYPFGGGTSAFFTDYAGYDDETEGPDGHRGLQRQLELTSCKLFDLVAREIQSGTLLEEFWSSPQCFFQVCDSSIEYHWPNSMYRWRPPTQSEHRLNVFLPLCYRARGLALWLYHWGHSSDDWDSTCNPYSFGFYLYDDQRNESMWDIFANDITPYLKAIDSTYLGLEWQRAYPYHVGSYPFRRPPSAAYIDSIWTASIIGSLVTEVEDSVINPDRGWFHIGEFTQSGTSAKYIMLVNRACSRGPGDSTEAPPILTTIRFNPTNLGLGDNVYVIDLADSVTFTEGQWQPNPETTYTAKMPDGKIPFTTTFRAGEGRLFKIVGAPAPYLSGDINTNLVYQGKMKVTGDITVPSGDTLLINGPARFEIFRCDSLESGADVNRVEFLVQGSLIISGYPDSALFIPDTIFGCGGGFPVNPQPGDWKGIYVDMTANCALEFCSVGYAENGLESRNNSNVQIQHCNFHDNEYNGIYCYKSYTDIQTSRFEENGLAGVDGVNADIDIYGSRFLDNASYGIRLSGTWTSDSTLIEYDTISCAPFPSQYAISISNIDAVRVYKCKARTYTQAGLYLNNSDALVRNNDFSANTNYGIYSYNYSRPKIRQCRIDTLGTGVKTSGYGSANIGAASDSGNCSFLSYGTGTYYIYHNWPTSGGTGDTLKAEANWFGGTPDRNKFYSSMTCVIDYEPYLRRAPAAPRMEVPAGFPFAFELCQNYPNPFNPATTISFTLEKPAYTSLVIYNLLGQRIVSLVGEFMASGEHTVTWNGRNQAGEPVASGIYFYVLQTGDRAEAKKMMLLR